MKYNMKFKHGTYTDNKFIYSVDLMFLYTKTILSTKILITKLLSQLKINDWGDLSPYEVIQNKNKSIEHYNRIIDSDLRYPIIINEKYQVIDGMHRLAKAYLNNKTTIKAYIIDNKLMKKFIIGKKKGKEWKNSDWEYYESLTTKDIKKIFNDRFN